MVTMMAMNARMMMMSLLLQYCRGDLGELFVLHRARRAADAHCSDDLSVDHQRNAARERRHLRHCDERRTSVLDGVFEIACGHAERRGSPRLIGGDRGAGGERVIEPQQI